MQEYGHLMLFGFISGITPGPNNILLLSTGVRWGFRRSLPLTAGITIGLPSVMFFAGTGLQQVFAIYPIIFTAMKLICGLWTVFLAYGMLRSDNAEMQSFRLQKPVNFLDALLLQWVNPKVWAIAISAMTLFMVGEKNSISLLLRTILPITAAIIPANLAWCLFGVSLSKILQSKKRLRIFNYTMALALILSIVPVFRT